MSRIFFLIQLSLRYPCRRRQLTIPIMQFIQPIVGKKLSNTDRSLLLHLFQEAKKSDYPQLNDSDFFEIFVPYHYLKHYELDFSDIEDGIVDGADDGGIDSIYCLCDGRPISEIDHSSVRKNCIIDLFIFTNKFQNSFPTGVLNDVRVTLSDLFEFDQIEFDKASKNYNDDLTDICGDFRTFYITVSAKFPHLRIHLVYATASSDPAKPSITSRLDQIKSDLLDKFSECAVEVVAADARVLLSAVREPAEEVRPLQLNGSSINLSRGPSYVALVRLVDYYKFVCNKDGGIEQRLFEDNVRDFEGDVQVNQEISSTLSELAGSDFWWLNNGASIICDSATLSGSQLQIKNPKIVNGLQTSRCLYRHYSNSKLAEADSRLILVRVISAEDEDVRAEIIRATNRQTPIAPSQLIATSRIHKDIELHLRTKGLYYERRKNHWKNQGKQKSDIVTITDLAQAMISVIAGKPNTARARPGSLLKESNNIVFDSEYDLRIYEKAITLVRSIDALIGDTLKDCGRRDRNNIKYHVTAKTVYDSCGGIFSAERFLNNELVGPDHRRKIVRSSYNIYEKRGATDRVAKSDDFWVAVRETLIK